MCAVMKLDTSHHVQESSVEPDAKNAHPRPIKKQSSRPKVLRIYTCSGLLTTNSYICCVYIQEAAGETNRLGSYVYVNILGFRHM